MCGAAVEADGRRDWGGDDGDDTDAAVEVREEHLMAAEVDCDAYNRGQPGAGEQGISQARGGGGYSHGDAISWNYFLFFFNLNFFNYYLNWIFLKNNWKEKTLQLVNWKIAQICRGRKAEVMSVTSHLGWLPRNLGGPEWRGREWEKTKQWRKIKWRRKYLRRRRTNKEDEW